MTTSANGRRRGRQPTTPREPRLYGRRRGRKLRPGRQRLIEDLLPRLRVPGTQAAATLDLKTLFDPPPQDIWLEVGFGGGEHLAAQAAAHPEVGFIGCEPYLNGVAALLARIEEQGLDNIRIHDDDARQLLAALPYASIARVFVLFPDPWPKTRQRKRRLVSSETLDRLSRIMADGGELRVATDDMGYVAWILERACRHPAFEWLADGPRDWRERPPDWPETRYEAKAKQDRRACVYLRFRRVPRAAARSGGQ